MYSIAGRKQNQKNWLNYRLYSRQILSQPMNMDLHTSRIMSAMELEQKEPLQGALADMFYGCWFDVPYFGDRMLAQVKEKLNTTMVEAFTRCVDGADYIFSSSELATRWSVLVSPSMSTYEHQLRISADDSRAVADNVISTLLDILEDEDEEDADKHITAIENDFFAHCLVCNDRLAFSIVWWELAKNNWQFHQGWTQCRQALEQKTLN